jgi:hypothetical protein
MNSGAAESNGSPGPKYECDDVAGERKSSVIALGLLHMLMGFAIG